MDARMLLSAYRASFLQNRHGETGILTTWLMAANIHRDVMPAVPSCPVQVCKVLVFLLQNDVDPHIETQGVQGRQDFEGNGGFTLLCI